MRKDDAALQRTAALLGDGPWQRLTAHGGRRALPVAIAKTLSLGRTSCKPMKV
jgi:hypothetical protein